jgi:hypothetical protein
MRYTLARVHARRNERIAVLHLTILSSISSSTRAVTGEVLLRASIRSHATNHRLHNHATDTILISISTSKNLEEEVYEGRANLLIFPPPPPPLKRIAYGLFVVHCPSD